MTICYSRKERIGALRINRRKAQGESPGQCLADATTTRRVLDAQHGAARVGNVGNGNLQRSDQAGVSHRLGDRLHHDAAADASFKIFITRKYAAPGGLAGCGQVLGSRVGVFSRVV